MKNYEMTTQPCPDCGRYIGHSPQCQPMEKTVTDSTVRIDRALVDLVTGTKYTLINYSQSQVYGMANIDIQALRGDGVMVNFSYSKALNDKPKFKIQLNDGDLFT